VSDDRGKSWREHPLAGGDDMNLIGIDPTDPDTVALLLDRSQKDAIVVSRDEGASWQPYLEVAAYGGMAWATDGRLWIGDLGEYSDGEAHGLWAAPNAATAPVLWPQSDYPVQCVVYEPRSDTLYACQHFGVGTIAPDTGAYSKLLSFTEVSELAACDDFDVASSCQSQLCQAYCGPTHFAIAPVCAVYDTPGCGVPVAREEGAGWAATPPTGEGMTLAAASVGDSTRPMVSKRASGGCAIAAGRPARAELWLIVMWLWRLRAMRTTSRRNLRTRATAADA
jgi:hypothetical protein